jgi:tetratricopeptide (TPR) repeat protein
MEICERSDKEKARNALAKGLNHDIPVRNTSTFCHLLWERAFINQYGDIFFCCLCRPEPVGNIYKHDLAYIWQKSQKAGLFRRMSLNGCLSCYSQCTVLSKKEKESTLGLGWLNVEKGRYREAEELFKKALELNPRSESACVAVGWIYKHYGKYAKAKELFNRALKLNPGSSSAYAELGWLYKEQGKLGEAKELFKKALVLNPNTPSASVGLDRLNEKQDKPIKTKLPLKEVLKSNSTNDEVYIDLCDGDCAGYPRTLHLLFGTFCTVNCIMCPQSHQSKAMLNNNILKRNIDWSRIDDIILQGGEILAMKGAKELFIWLTEKMKKKPKLVTNGLLINHEWAQRLVKNSCWIEVSVNASTKQTHEFVNRKSDFRRVIDNIRMLVYLKGKYRLDTEIRYHFTVVPENAHEIAPAIKLANDLGCDLIAYSYDSPAVENFLNKNKDVKRKIIKQIEQLVNDGLKIKIQRNQLEQLGILGNFYHRQIID